MSVDTIPVEAQSFSVETEADLWQVPEWAERNGAKARVVRTCVGPYGAIEQGAGVTYFDIGDTLLAVHGQLVAVPEGTIYE